LHCLVAGFDGWDFFYYRVHCGGSMGKVSL
jgi:hypothetical protein